MKKLLVIAVMLIVFVSSVYALSATIGNAKMILRENVTPGQEILIDRSILVRNVNNVSVSVELTPYGDLKDSLVIGEPEFVLGPHESRDVDFNITLDQPGYYDNKIAVAFKPYPNVNESAGVGLMSNVIVIASDPNAEPNTPDNTTNDNNNQTSGNDNQTSVPGDAPNPVIGIGLVALIVLLGIVVFVMMRRK